MKTFLTGILALALLAAGGVSASAGDGGVTALEARDAALAMTGGGTVSALELVSPPGSDPVYQIVIVNDGARYEVSVNARTGDVLRLASNREAAGQAAAAPGPDRRPSSSRFFRPRNPPVSRADAIEIAYAYLASRGISASFRRDSGIDRERGRWVWELEFRDGRTELEFYIDVDTGEIVKFEIER